MKSAGAIVAGFFATALASLGVDVLLHAAGVFPPWGQPSSDGLLALALAYRVAFTIGGGAVTARLAPRAPMKHAIALGAIGSCFALLGAAATWNAGAAFGPHWYSVSLIVTAIPCVLAGARFGQPIRAHAS